MKKHWKIISIILLIIIVLITFKMCKSKNDKAEWKLQTAEIGSISEIVTASGTINPVTTVEVGTEVSGKIEKIYKDYNETVKKGDLLAKIDTETLELNAQENKAALLSAESSAKDTQLDEDLLRDLVKRNMGAEYDLKKAEVKNEQAIQTVTRARLAYQRAVKNLKNAYIYSPIDGVIVSRSVDEGQTVAASMSTPTLFNIANDLKKMQIDASVDEADIGKIQLNMPVKYTVDAYPEESFEGIVKQVRLDAQNESNVITYTVIISIDNPDMLLLPGMTANVQIIVNQKDDILSIPSRALQFKPSKEVWESFGLVWNDSLLARNRKGMGMSMSGNTKSYPNKNNSGTTVATQNQSPENNKTASSQLNNDNKRPRMSKEDFEKLTPEQRKQLREKFGRGPRGNQSQQNQPAVTKVNNSQSVDIFKLRAQYISNQTQRGSVWVLENNQPKKVRVIYGITDGNRVEIISGLKAGQQIIIGVNGTDSSTSDKTSAMMPMGGMGPR